VTPALFMQRRGELLDTHGSYPLAFNVNMAILSIRPAMEIPRKE
jgi:hypothetical protein